MNSNEEYEAPSISKVGTLQEITKQGFAPNSDLVAGQNNTAFPVGS